jgi:hypothetical protein
MGFHRIFDLLVNSRGKIFLHIRCSMMAIFYLRSTMTRMTQSRKRLQNEINCPNTQIIKADSSTTAACAQSCKLSDQLTKSQTRIVTRENTFAFENTRVTSIRIRFGAGGIDNIREIGLVNATAMRGMASMETIFK